MEESGSPLKLRRVVWLGVPKILGLPWLLLTLRSCS